MWSPYMLSALCTFSIEWTASGEGVLLSTHQPAVSLMGDGVPLHIFIMWVTSTHSTMERQLRSKASWDNLEICPEVHPRSLEGSAEGGGKRSVQRSSYTGEHKGYLCIHMEPKGMFCSQKLCWDLMASFNKGGLAG